MEANGIVAVPESPLRRNADPHTIEYVKAWLEDLGGGYAANAEAYAEKLAKEGYESKRSLRGLGNVDELQKAMAIPRGVAKELVLEAQNASHSRMWPTHYLCPLPSLIRASRYQQWSGQQHQSYYRHPWQMTWSISSIPEATSCTDGEALSARARQLIGLEIGWLAKHAHRDAAMQAGKATRGQRLVGDSPSRRLLE